MAGLLYAHTPWQRRHEFLPFLIQHKLNPELYLSAQILEQITPLQVQELRTTLHDHGLQCTLHAPFAGMDPGSTESATREATRRGLQQTLRLAMQLQPRVVVFHSGCTGQRSQAELDRWIAASISFWNEQIPLLVQTDTVIALENIFEQGPTALRQIIEGVRNRRVRHCFDIGHFNLKGTVSLKEWFQELGRYCVECHLHDNHGSSDDHLPLGEGTIDFTWLTGLLRQHAPAAILTLEAHTPERLQRTYAALQPLLGIKR